MSASLRALACLLVFLANFPTFAGAQQCIPPSVKASLPDADIGGGEPREMALGEFHHDGFLDLAVVNVGSGEVAILRGQGSSFVLEQNLFFGSAADVVVVDFNHDGWDDVSVSVPLDNEVDVQLSDGNGGFEPSASEFPVETTPMALTSGDYDGDGHVDLAVFNSIPKTISILRGSGTGGFTPLPAFNFPAASQLLTADLNRDGWLDLVSVDDSGNQIHAALGDGSLDAWVVRSSSVNATGPEGLVIGRFDQDGFLDAVTVNTGSGELEFLRGIGDGTFVPGTTQFVGGGTFTRIAAGDMDGDGDLDVAIPDKSNFQVFISLNDGQGNFALPVSFVTSGLGYDAAIADFDRDGRSDVVLSLPLANRVQLLLNDFGTPCANPSFERLGRSFAVDGSPVAIAAADFDEDGSPDFVTANQGNPGYTHWVGLGNGSFDFPSSNPLGPNPVSNAVADIDFDSDLDVITAVDGKLTVRRNVGGSFMDEFSITLPANPYYVAAADVSGDGKVDLVVSLVSTHVLVFRNNGAGGFPTGESYVVGTNPRGVVIGDFDNDGLPDLAVAEAGNQIVFFKNQGTGTFLPQGFRTLSASPTALRAAHLNAGGNLDLVVTVGFGGAGAKLQTLLGDGAFGFTLVADLATGDTTATRHGLEVGDFNQDGRTDVAVALSPMPRVRLFFGNGSGAFSGTKSEVTPEAPGALAATDFDRDGILDLLVTQPSTETVLALPGTGAGRFSPEFYTPPGLPNAGSRGVAHADFSGDGVLDLVIANFNNDSVTRFLGQGNGTFDSGSNFSIAPARNPNWVTVEDFNHDGKLDILASAAGSTELALLPGNGSGGFGTPVVTQFGSPPFMSRAADFDLDGKLDVAVLTGNVIRIMRGTGGGSFTFQSDQSLGGTGTGLWVGDFNRDGLVDLAATQTTDDILVLFTANGEGGWSPSSTFIGIDPGDFDAGDFNGDGYVDFAIPLERDSKVSIVLSNGLGGYGLPGPELFTATSPVALRVLDWNRDGDLDLVVAGKGQHVLAFHKGEGLGAFSPFPPGTAGVRIPTYLTVADFNADGRTDVAVVPDTTIPVSPPGVGVVLNTNCRSRQLKLETDVSTCDTPGAPFFSKPRFRFQDDGENLIQCEDRAITASIVPGTGSPGASPVGTTTEFPNSGTVEFMTLGVSQGGARFRLQFTHAEARRKLSRFFSQALSPTISGPSALCEGDPAVYVSDPFYEWYEWKLGPTVMSMASSVNLTGALSPGQQRIDLFVEADTCFASSFVDVDVTAALAGVDVVPAGPITLCATCTGPVATVSVIGGGTLLFQWGYRTTRGGVVTPLAGETSSSYTIEAADLGTGTFYLVATVTPTCGAVGVSNEVQIDISTTGGLEPLKAFTARSTKEQNFLELATPTTGPCEGIRILRNNTDFPSDPHATGPPNFWIGASDIPCPALGKTFVVDAGLVDDQNYFYSAWVKDENGNFSARDEVAGRPFDHTVGKVKWAYSTGYTSMSQAGLRIKGTTSVYIVSNDSLVHGLTGGATGGFWLANAVPAQLGAPSQARPPVLSIAVGPAVNGAALVTSQDGKLYALDADTLAEIWTPAFVGDMVTGAAAALFGGNRLLFSGSRNTVNPNELRIFDADGGTLEGSFDNSPDPAIGRILGGFAVDTQGARVFFGSQPGASLDTLWAVDVSNPTSPALFWSKDIGEVWGTPVFLPGRGVVAATQDSTVELLDAANGNSLWGTAYNAGDGPVKGFVFPHRHSDTWNFLFSTNMKVTSIKDGPNPTWNWEVTTIPSPSTPIWLPGTTSALVGGGDGKLYLLNGIDTVAPMAPTVVGLPLTVGSPAVGVPAFDVPNRMIYVGTEEGVIYAVEYPFP